MFNPEENSALVEVDMCPSPRCTPERGAADTELQFIPHSHLVFLLVRFLPLRCVCGEQCLPLSAENSLSLIVPVAPSVSPLIWLIFPEEGWPEQSSGPPDTPLQEVWITLKSFAFSFSPSWWFYFPRFIPINYSSLDPQFIPSYWYSRQGISAVFQLGLDYL